MGLESILASRWLDEHLGVTGTLSEQIQQLRAMVDQQPLIDRLDQLSARIDGLEAQLIAHEVEDEMETEALQDQIDLQTDVDDALLDVVEEVVDAVIDAETEPEPEPAPEPEPVSEPEPAPEPAQERPNRTHPLARRIGG